MQDEVEDEGFDQDEIMRQWEAQKGDGNVASPPETPPDDLPDDFDDEVINFKA